MNLIITDPVIDDHKNFHELINEPDWQREFPGFKGMTLNECKDFFDFWILNKDHLFPQFLRMIKITYEEDLNLTFNDNNSITIGFIGIFKTDGTDLLFSGKHYLLNFGISKSYYGHNIMTNALEMTIERLYDLGYNHISAYIKNDNIASEKILKKCGFKFEASKGIGKTYTLSFDK